MKHRTAPGMWHDFACCYWRFYDTRGQQVAVISDEAYYLAGFTPRDVILATS